MSKPCPGLYGMDLYVACPTCQHIVVAHRVSDSICSVCEAVAEVRAACAPDEVKR